MTGLRAPVLDWRPDLPDPRDYTPAHEETRRLLSGVAQQSRQPERVDWRVYFTPVEEQVGPPQGAACACAGLLEYFERRSLGQMLVLSKIFVYKVTRRLLNSGDDAPVDLRTTWKAILRFGVPAREHCAEGSLSGGVEPDAFAYAVARRFDALRYVRLDPRGCEGDKILATIKAFLAAGFPCTLGFPLSTAEVSDGEIPYPTLYDRVVGGQAAAAVGYDDRHRVRSDKGALLIRNSWGTGWGDKGYGWLPYSFVREKLAHDFWTVLHPAWLESGEFLQPS